MRVLNLAFLAITLLAFIACGGSGNSPASTKGFDKIEQSLKKKFGNNAYYTDLTIVPIEGIGNAITTTVTKKPASLKMGEWTYSQKKWNQTSEISLEVPEGSKAADFMYQLDDEISITKLGGLVEEARKNLTAEKNLKKPRLSLAAIKYPNNGDRSKAKYLIQLQPEHGGTTFTYSYKLNGEFIEMDY